MKRLLLSSLLAVPYLVQAQTFVPVPATDPPLLEVRAGSVTFADIDGDNDQDVLITGQSNTGTPMAALYTNDGSGGFTERSNTPFDAVDFSSVAFADIDGDNDQDVLITGLATDVPSASLYINDGNGGFTKKSDTPFEAVQFGSVAFADVDGDEDQDLLISGRQPLIPTTTLYINDGSGGFTKRNDTPFEGVQSASIAFADIDGDNDQDLVITGEKTSNPIAALYSNDGNGEFTQVNDTPFEGVFLSSIAFADVDGDNDQDLFITGRNRLVKPTASLYINNGSGGFTKRSDTPFEEVQTGSIAFADVDRDDDQDLLITGMNRASTAIATLYTNDGNGGFAKWSDTPFEGVRSAAIAFADVDEDDDHDVLITGTSAVSPAITTAKLYLNTTETSSSVDVSSPSQRIFARIVPNPSTHNIALSYSAGKSGELSITVSDAAGRTLMRHNVPVSEGPNTIPIDCSSLSSGSYIVELEQGDLSTSTKLLIQ